MNVSRSFARLFCGFLIGYGAVSAHAATHRVAGRIAFDRTLNNAQPGDVIVLAPGNYGGAMVFVNIHGNADAPIRVVAEDKNDPPTWEGQLHFTACSWLTIEGLRVRQSDRNGINIDEGGPDKPSSHHILLRDCIVEDVGPNGNLDGIKLSGLVDSAVIGCIVRRWGRGGSGIDMVGCRRIWIDSCRLESTNDRGSNGIQAKGGSADVLITRTHFVNAGQRALNLGGSTGEEWFRPRGPHVVEARRLHAIGCTLQGSLTPVAFVSSVDCLFTLNSVLDPDKWMLRLLQEKPVPPFTASGNHVISHNRFVFQRARIQTDVNVGPNTRPDSLRFIANYWYAKDAPERSMPSLPGIVVENRVGPPPAATTEEIKAAISRSRELMGISFPNLAP